MHLLLSGSGFFAVGRIVPRLQRIKARKRAGSPQVDPVAALCDRYDQTMISHVEAGRSAFLLDGPVNATRGLGVSFDYLVGLTDDPTPSAELTVVGITPEIRRLPGARPVPVRRLQTEAGRGVLDLDEEVKAYAYFRREWLSRQGLVADRCSIISVMGEALSLTRFHRVGMLDTMRGITSASESTGQTSMAIPSPKRTHKAPFRPRARVLQLLGDELIGSPGWRSSSW